MMSILPIIFCWLLASRQVAAMQRPQVPKETGTETFSEPKRITGSFNGGFKKYGRGVSCGGGEGGESRAVFIVEDGGTIEDVIIGPDQSEGIHCRGSCTLKNVWWISVCEDALTLWQGAAGVSRITGGGAMNAKDKVIQHNGQGEVHITDFYVSDFGKLWCSCGNCPNNKGPRKVYIDGVYAEKGKYGLAGTIANFGDQAIIKNTCGYPVAQMCESYEGCSGPCDTKKLGVGFNTKSCVDGGGNTDTCDGSGPPPSSRTPPGSTVNNEENPNSSTGAVPPRKKTPKEAKNPTDGTPTVSDKKGGDTKNTPTYANTNNGDTSSNNNNGKTPAYGNSNNCETGSKNNPETGGNNNSGNTPSYDNTKTGDTCTNKNVATNPGEGENKDRSSSGTSKNPKKKSKKKKKKKQKKQKQKKPAAPKTNNTNEQTGSNQDQLTEESLNPNDMSTDYKPPAVYQNRRL